MLHGGAGAHGLLFCVFGADGGHAAVQRGQGQAVMVLGAPFGKCVGQPSEGAQIAVGQCVRLATHLGEDFLGDVDDGLGVFGGPQHQPPGIVHAVLQARGGAVRFAVVALHPAHRGVHIAGLMAQSGKR